MYEYQWVAPNEKALNAAGQQGWQAVGIGGHDKVLMKRPAIALPEEDEDA